MTTPNIFDDYTKSYNEILRENTSFFSEDDTYFAKYKIDIVRKNITRPVSRILEYGCGIGRNIHLLKSAFPQAAILGSDISNESLKLAREQNPDVEFFQEMDAKKSIEPFDLIFVAGVIHHIPVNERASAMQTLFNRLSPTGQLMIFEHNPYNPLTRKIVRDCPYDKDAVLLAPSELKRLLHQAGFVAIQNSYCLFFPPRLSKLLSLEAYLGWLPLGGQYWTRAHRMIF